MVKNLDLIGNFYCARTKDRKKVKKRSNLFWRNRWTFSWNRGGRRGGDVRVLSSGQHPRTSEDGETPERHDVGVGQDRCSEPC